MAMAWQDVGRLIAPLAPVAGSILGGFLPIPGGSIIGQQFGSLIARAFGVAPTPDAVHAAVSDAVTNANRDQVVAKINAATEQARAEINGFVEAERIATEALVKNLSDVNATMRVETSERTKLLLAGVKENIFFTGWRPFFGWVFGGVYLAFGLMLTFVTGKTAWLAPDPLTVLKEAWPIFLSYFGPGGLVLGVMIPSRTAEKVAAINAEAATPPPLAKPLALPPPQQQPMPRVAFPPQPIPRPLGSKPAAPPSSLPVRD